MINRLPSTLLIALVFGLLPFACLHAQTDDDRLGWKRLSALGSGYVIWESNRDGGPWRIWRRELDGSGERRLSPDEPGRDHICPAISPDGKWIAYMSQPGDIGYNDPGQQVVSPLRIMRADGSGDRQIAGNARRISGGNRAVVWASESRLHFLDGEGRARSLELPAGTIGAPLLAEAGFIPNGALTYAYDRHHVHPFDSKSGTLSKTGIKMEGCEPVFTLDSRWSVRMTGAGGPISRVDPATSALHSLLAKDDPRLPPGRGYLYFPQVSPCGRLLAFAASPGQHDHFTSDYDVFVAPIEPDTLELTGAPVRYTFNPKTDRYPAAYLAGLPPGRRARPIASPPAVITPAERLARPVTRKQLVFAFQSGKQAPLIRSADGTSLETADLAMRGLARLDRNYALELARGACAVPRAGAKLTGALKKTSALTLEAVFRSESLAQTGPARIVTLSRNTGERNFTLGQERDSLILRLRTTRTGGNGTNPQVTLGPVDPTRDQHVLLTYQSPGELVVYLDGQETLRTAAVQGDFSKWEDMELLLGDELTRDRDWRGRIEGVALYDSVFAPEQARLSAETWRKRLASRKPVRRIRVATEVTALSRVPTLEKIAPYREGLVMAEHRVMESKGDGAPPPGSRIRVAHWGLLDGKTPPETAALRPDARTALELEPFDDQPQVQSLYLSDDLAIDPDASVWLDITPPARP